MNRFFRITFLLVFTLTICHTSDAQDNKWWQKLFKKKQDTTQQDNQPDYTQPEKPTDTPIVDSTTVTPDTVDPEIPDFDVPSTPGNVKLSLDEGIAALDKEFKDNPPNVRGYRVQIFFGDLTPAREKRARFISNNPGMKCYLHQAAPNFGVRVGNYRDMESAYRMLLKLQGSYPNALIVQDKIEG